MGSYASPDYHGTAVVAFANTKGGVGRTTACANIAAALARQGLRVLCLDLDPQAGLTCAVGASPQGSVAMGACQLFACTEVPLAATVMSSNIENVDLIPASPYLEQCAETLTGGACDQVLRARLTAAFRGGTTSAYDLVLLDCPASLGPLMRNGLTAATHLVVPVTPRFAAFKGAAALGELVEALHYQAGATAKLLGILVTAYDKGLCLDVTLYRLLRERIETRFGDYVFASIVGQSAAVGEAEVGGMPVVLAQPGSLAAAWYRAAAEEVLERLRKDSAGTLGMAKHAVVA